MEKISQKVWEIMTGNRMKSLLWRTGAMFFAGLVGIFSDTVLNAGLSPQVTVLLGLIFGEVTKWLNTQTVEVQA